LKNVKKHILELFDLCSYRMCDVELVTYL